MNEIELQRPDGFPEGFEIVQQLHGAGVFGEVFEVRDRRTAGSEQVTRTVRFFRDPDPKWRGKLLEYAQQLVALELPYVSLPLEVGQTAAGGLYLVGQRLGQVVSAFVSSRQGLKKDDWDRVAENLLEALANLHKHEFIHGDVRPRNAYFEPDCAARPSVWLADTAIGHLPWWSEGDLRDAESRSYRPPEWEDQYSPQPTKKADLYALGLTLVECTLGTAANLNRESQPVDPDEIKQRLREKGASDRLQRVIHWMLAPLEAERPGDAGEVLALYRKAPVSTTTLRNWQWAAAALALMLVVVVGYSMFGDPKSVLKSRIRDLKHEKAGVETKLVRSETTLEEKNSEYNSLLTTLELPESIVKRKLFEAEEDIKELEKELFDCRGGVSGGERLARKRWTSEISRRAPIKESAQLTIDHLHGVSTSISDKSFLDNKSILDDEEYKENFSAWDQAYQAWKAEDLDQWVRHARNDQGEIAEGREEIQSLLTRLAASAEEPWSAEKREAVTQHLANLNQARKAWDDFAKSERGFHAEAFNDQEDVVRRICVGWKKDFQDKINAWKLRLKVGKTPDETRKRKRLYIITDNAYDHLHNWQNPQTHSYDPKKAFSFKWVAGETVKIWFESPGAYAFNDVPNDREHIQRLIPGPVAVYRLHKQGRVEEGQNYLTLEVIDCPGPPLKQEIADVVPGSLKQLLGQ